MMTSCKKLRHNTNWSWRYTLLKFALKNADQAILGEILCLIRQKWRFWLILSIIFQFPSKKFRIPTIFFSCIILADKIQILLLLLLLIFRHWMSFASERQLGLTWNFQETCITLKYTWNFAQTCLTKCCAHWQNLKFKRFAVLKLSKNLS